MIGHGEISKSGKATKQQNGQAQMQQQTVTEYYIPKRQKQKELEHPVLSAHQIISGVREAVQNAMPGVYRKTDKIRSSTKRVERQMILHSRRGAKLSQNGQPVLQFRVAGSGYQSFRVEHRGFDGTGNYQSEPGGEKVKIHEPTDARWYNTSRWVNWIPGIRTEEEIDLENEKITGAIEKLEDEYGENVELEDVKYEHIRSKIIGSKERKNLPGPLAMGGKSNSGEYSIENLSQYILNMGIAYLAPRFEAWKRGSQESNIPVMLQGHSRGAVAVSEGAMMLRHWIATEYPQYEQYVKFEMIQYDPVPGMGSASGTHAEVDYRNESLVEDRQRKMKGLGDASETTVIYSLHTQYPVAFTPQLVKGCKRIILTPFDHSVGLGDVDSRYGERHRPAYTDASKGQVYRGSAISELEEGVYIVDENNTLVRFDNVKQAEKVIKEVLSNTWFQGDRHKVIMQAVNEWFRRRSGNQRREN